MTTAAGVLVELVVVVVVVVVVVGEDAAELGDARGRGRAVTMTGVPLSPWTRSVIRATIISRRVASE